MPGSQMLASLTSGKNGPGNEDQESPKRVRYLGAVDGKEQAPQQCREMMVQRYPTGMHR